MLGLSTILLGDEACEEEALDGISCSILLTTSMRWRLPDGLKAPDTNVLGPSVGVCASTGLLRVLLESERTTLWADLMSFELSQGSTSEDEKGGL